jgi:hypothetical protein
MVRIALNRAAERPADLRELDRKREIDRGWYQRARMVGYVCYADRFAGTLKEIPDKLDYLDELGVTYLHLMPLLKPRAGENDGGYAVQDHRAVDPRLGTMDDLSEVALGHPAARPALCGGLRVRRHPADLHGRELALSDDHGYAHDPALADDNRWMHRPVMDWAVAGQRHDPESVPGRVFGRLRRLATTRKQRRASAPGRSAGSAGSRRP